MVAENNQIDPRFDTMQEVGKWLVENDQTFSKLETAIQNADPNDSDKEEFLRITKELGGVQRGMRGWIEQMSNLIVEIEKIKAKYL